jgi:hypothetical protein
MCRRTAVPLARAKTAAGRDEEAGMDDSGASVFTALPFVNVSDIT